MTTYTVFNRRGWVHEIEAVYYEIKENGTLTFLREATSDVPFQFVAVASFNADSWTVIKEKNL